MLLMISAALAQDCNARELSKALDAASPASVGVNFKALADCDAKVATKKVAASFERVLPGEDGNLMVQAAIEIGATDAAREWVTNLQSDERSGTVKALGNACDTNEAIGPFLTETAEVLGDDFWTDRWYRSLAGCHDPGVQGLLADEVATPSNDRTRFFGVLEVYSTNLGGQAIPTLEGLLGSVTDEEELTYVVNAFADAAHVGHIDGQDPEATKAAVAAIVKAAPNLPTKAVEQARTTLTSLGAEDEADKLAVVRYSDALTDGQMTYGLVVLEVPTGCKKDAVWLGVHTGTATTTLWPDQAHDAIEAAATSGWEYPLAKKCKGSPAFEVILSNAPVPDDQLDAWYEEQQKDLLKRQSDKRIDTVEETAISL